MDGHQHDLQSSDGRRAFLRRLGMTAVATAALAGIADVAGQNPAGAAVRTKGANQVRGVGQGASAALQSGTVQSLYCYPNPGQCGSACQPNGVYCHLCTADTTVPDGSVGAYVYNMCIGGDTTFTLISPFGISPYLQCTPNPGHCGSGCQPNGVWCHSCTAVTVTDSGTGRYTYNMCIGGDYSFTLYP
jgi:hypothetical protein